MLQSPTQLRRKYFAVVVVVVVVVVIVIATHGMEDIRPNQYGS